MEWNKFKSFSQSSLFETNSSKCEIYKIIIHVDLCKKTTQNSNNFFVWHVNSLINYLDMIEQREKKNPFFLFDSEKTSLLLFLKNSKSYVDFLATKVVTLGLLFEQSNIPLLGFLSFPLPSFPRSFVRTFHTATLFPNVLF